MFCTRCGANVADGSAFCTNCGQPASGGVASATPVSAPPAVPAVQAPVQYAPPAYPALPQPVVLYAGFWLRFVAYFIDAFLLSIAFGIVILIALAFVGFGAVAAAVRNSDNADAIAPMMIFFFAVAVVMSLLVSWLYYAWMESSERQATLGKMALGLYVTDMQGRRISFAHASGRFFAKLITGLIPLAIGYIMAGFTAKKQALHDLIAGCLVLRKS